MKRATLLAAALFAMPFANATEGGEETLRLEAGPGAELVTGRCIVCHSVDYIEMNAPVLDRAGWEKTVRKMIDRFGAPITDGEAQQIVEYLGKHYSR